MLRKNKVTLHLSEAEYRLVLESPVNLRSKRIREGRYTDLVDEMIVEVPHQEGADRITRPHTTSYIAVRANAWAAKSIKGGIQKYGENKSDRRSQPKGRRVPDHGQ